MVKFREINKLEDLGKKAQESLLTKKMNIHRLSLHYENRSIGLPSNANYSTYQVRKVTGNLKNVTFKNIKIKG
jgi:hypothetical protein